jgi:polyhydroxyalkanoate synthase subunit PhaC
MATRKKNNPPPSSDSTAFAGLMQQMAPLPQISPQAIAEVQSRYLSQATALWNAALGQGEAPATKDRRFAAPEWAAHPALPAQQPHPGPDGRGGGGR